MALPETTAQDPAERVPLQTVSAVGGEREDGVAAAKAPGSRSTGRRQTDSGFSSWFSRPRVKWMVVALVAVVLLFVIVLAAALLSTGKGAGESDGASVLTFWPMQEPGHNLIWFRAGNFPGARPGWRNLTAQLETLVAGYDSVQSQRQSDVIQCFGQRPEQGKVCSFDVNTVAAPCTADYDFGYPRGSPCVFIQFANVSGWDPEPPSLNDSSQVLPEELQPLLKPELLPLHCDGDSMADRENIGDLVYSPYQGFRTEFFPYTGHRDYMPPLVAVQFRRPEIGVVIGVRCRLWARNPPPGKVSTEITFHLLVD
ncbi:sodium/potassium-transporting ATPase subunit beta-2-like [Haemaphysalis longicornis]